MSPTPHCSMKPPPRPKRWRWRSAPRTGKPNRSSSIPSCRRNRAVPGRLAGVSIASRAHPASGLGLRTGARRTRREKAPSNICTAQVLLAVIASMYAVYHGPEGLPHIARNVHRRTAVLAAGLRKLGFALKSEAFFDTVTVDAAGRQGEIVAGALAERINLRIGERTLGIALDE